MNKNFGFSLILIVLTCLIILLMLCNFPCHEKLQKPQLDRRPNVIMYKVNYYQYNDKGDLHSHLVSPCVFHFIYKNSSHFTVPHYFICTSQHVPWVISADHGKSQNAIEWIYLWGHVRIHKLLQETKVETTITTKDITIFPHRSFARTDQPVTIVCSNSIITAIGMIIDLKNSVIHLLSYARGIDKTNTDRAEKILKR
ncbi:MAG: LPS export ABC transporter periplasmic protein LptC [Coxiella endosymbiont of Dermacentor nuttalli]